MGLGKLNRVGAGQTDTHDLEARIQAEPERDEIDDIRLVVHHDDPDARLSHAPHHSL